MKNIIVGFDVDVDMKGWVGRTFCLSDLTRAWTSTIEWNNHWNSSADGKAITGIDHDGDTYTYTGSSKDGLPHGKGIIT